MLHYHGRHCFWVVLLTFFLGISQPSVSGQKQESRIKVAVLSLGHTTEGRVAAETIVAGLKAEAGFALVDMDQSRLAASGVGYSGSLNLSLNEARDLGAALGCDFFVIGDAQTLRRSPSTGPIYYESYASVFIVSARTGRLITWQRLSSRAEHAGPAQQSALRVLASDETRHKIIAAITRAREVERDERAQIVDRQTPVIEAAPDDEKKAEAEGLRLPRPFRRLVPAYPQSAADAEAEATVDVLADIDADGEVKRVEIARWGGFGLDESTLETVQRLHFFPAMRDGVAMPIRVLLRYNFRKPPR